MQYQSDFPHQVTETPDMGIVLPDGTRLSARVWMPDDAQANPVPAILEFLPYRKRDGTIARDQYNYPWFAGHGYAGVRVDMRGSGDSEGLFDDEYSERELQDACDVIAWLAKQPWCSGAVGMMGISWGGFNGLQVAALAPPALKAVITVCSTVDRYADDIHYKGGVQLNENFGWAMNMLSYMSRPPDPALVGEEVWQDMWRHRLQNQTYLLEPWLEHQHRDHYWQHGSVCQDYSAIKAAVLSIGGWHDGYRNTISHLVSNLKSPVKGIVGPWNHKYPNYAGPKPAIGFLQEAKRWWDQYLKGQETGVAADPDIRLYLMDSVAPKRWHDRRPGRWIAEQSWPSPDLTMETLHFSDAGLTTAPGRFEASISSPQTCGIESPEYFPFAFADELPGDQQVDDAVSLCIDGARLEDTLDIVGAPLIKLALASDSPTGQICVRLCDLRPDGSSAFITFGVLNLCHHKSHAQPEALTPGQVFDVTLALDHIAYRIPKGHRLRVSISSAYWPFLWPSPDKPVLTVTAGRLDVPTRALATEDEWVFQQPVAAPAWRAKTLREDSYERRSDQDASTGRTETIIDIDDGLNQDLDHGLISGSATQERWGIDPQDPLSATGEIAWQQTGGREGAMWRTEVRGHMRCDKEHFYSNATLQCWLNDQIFFERKFDIKYPRKLG